MARVRKPCENCGGPKPAGAGRRFCDNCQSPTIAEHQRRYRARHLGRCKEQERKWRRKNPDKVKESHRKYRKANPEKFKEYQRRSKRKNADRLMLKRARIRAKDKGLSFNLTTTDVEIPRCCPVLGIPLYLSDCGLTGHSPTLDRVDNAKGYVKGNVVVVSWRANRLKSDATIEELRAIADFYEMYTITQ